MGAISWFFGVHRSSAKLVFISVALIVFQGCTLDRTGGIGCPKDGSISCNVSNVSSLFTTQEHSYYFSGQCTLDEGASNTIGSTTTMTFNIAGDYNPQSLEFRETVQIDHSTYPAVEGEETGWSIKGVSVGDPWVNTSLPVGVVSHTGDPNAFATALCIDPASIPNEYRRVPFSRNVVLHALTLQQRFELLGKSLNPIDTEDAPAASPPCPPAYVHATPEIVMPLPSMIYQAGVGGIPIELRSQCGEDTYDYGKSIYAVEFESSVQGSSNWEDYRTFEIPMNAFSAGGSRGFDILPVKDENIWRMRAIQYATTKSNKSQYSAWSDWVYFQIGEQNLNTELLKDYSDLLRSADRQRQSSSNRRADNQNDELRYKPLLKSEIFRNIPRLPD